MAERVPPPFVARPPVSVHTAPCAATPTARRQEPSPGQALRPAERRSAARWPRPPWVAPLAAFLLLTTGIGPSTASYAARAAERDSGSAAGPERAVPYIGLLLRGSYSLDLAIERGLRRSELRRSVNGLDAGSPAESAHINMGDLLLSADGVPLHSERDLDAVLGRHAPGTLLRLVVRRDRENREVPVMVRELPPADLGFRVEPLCDRDSARAQLPAGLTPGDSLPVVSWVTAGVTALRRGGFKPGVVIASLNGQVVRSPRELRDRARSLHVGDNVWVRFYSRARLRQVLYLAQAPLPLWAGLSLEEITPILAESESLSTAGGNIAGLFVRRVERGTAAEKAKLRAGDRILGIRAEPRLASGPSGSAPEAQAGPPTPVGAKLREWELTPGAPWTPVASVAQFDSLYAAIPEGLVTRLQVAHKNAAVESISLERGYRIGTLRERPTVAGRFGFEAAPGSGGSGIVSFDPYQSPVPVQGDVNGFPVTDLVPVSWSRVTGPCFGGSTQVRWDALPQPGTSSRRPEIAPARLSLDWTWDYGVGDRHWHHSVVVGGGPVWRPKVRYFDGPAPFYHEEISNPTAASLSSAFTGKDRLRYTHDRGWTVGWMIAPGHLPGHQLEFRLSRFRQSPVANAPTSSLFGTNRFAPNPTEGVTSGMRNSATIRYSFSDICWRTWSRLFVDAEVRAAGGALGGDFDFVRWEANAAPWFRLARRLYLDSRLRAGIATGRLPLQEEFYAGGSGTLPGYADFQFTGDRTLLGRTQLSVVPFGRPEQMQQFRVFAGLDAGHAWRSDQVSSVPRLRTDFALGAGLVLVTEDAAFFPVGISIAWARPLDEGIGRWRLEFDFMGGTRR
jgi:S1-C subfamily serine protease